MEGHNRKPAVRWVKEWYPQETITPGRSWLCLRWVKEDEWKAWKEKCKMRKLQKEEPEPTGEKLFLCNHEGCGRAFLDCSDYKKHAQIHRVKQHVCPHDGCGRIFSDKSKLSRHLVVHTGEKNFVCSFPGCDKAFNLDFNLKSHMKTHSPENYHNCPYKGCDKRFTTEYKLDNHIKKQHEKYGTSVSFKHNPPEKKLQKSLKPTDRSASVDRPHSCPCEGCEKAYIHKYKLNLHLRKEHPDYDLEENGHRTPGGTNHCMPDASEMSGCVGKSGMHEKFKRTSLSLIHETPPAMLARTKCSSFKRRNIDSSTNMWPQEENCKGNKELEEGDHKKLKVACTKGSSFMNSDTFRSMQPQDDGNDSEETEEEDGNLNFKRTGPSLLHDMSPAKVARTKVSSFTHRDPRPEEENAKVGEETEEEEEEHHENLKHKVAQMAGSSFSCIAIDTYRSEKENGDSDSTEDEDYHIQFRSI